MLTLATLVLALGAYLVLAPVPIAPVAWTAPTAPGYAGPHAANTGLQKLESISLNGERGPEHVVVGVDGRLYTGTASGRILRIEADGSAQQVFSDTGGRPLGMAFAPGGGLIVADALKGLLSVSATGKPTVLLPSGSASGPISFPNAVAVAANGKVYFTDSSMRFSPSKNGTTQEAALLDVLEQSATGRILEYTPAGNTLRVVATGLSFANGIALTSDETAVLVSESARYRVWKIAVAADGLDVARASPQAQVLLDNLPGYPDNLMRGLDGKIWLGFGGQRNELDAMAQQPFMRSLALRIPRALWKLPRPYGHVMAFTEDGKVVADLQDPGGASLLTTGVTETPERLYIHNVDGSSLGWLPRQGGAARAKP